MNFDMIDYVWGRTFRDIDITEGLSALHRPVFLALAVTTTDWGHRRRGIVSVRSFMISLCVYSNEVVIHPIMNKLNYSMRNFCAG